MASDYPTAAPGYGKRSAPSQHARSADDFAHLPEREAYLAHFIDQLPDGAAMDAKTLARLQPRYGQQAVRSALRALDVSGHLMRVREKVGDGITRWVYRTFFSRTARPAGWWRTFLESRQAGGEGDAVEPAPPPRSQAYRALASLGSVTPKLMLSAKECEELEPFAAEWFARNVTVEQFRHAMSNDLPATVRAPGAFVRRRLVDRIPPVPPEAPATRLVCAACRAPVAHAGAPCRRCTPVRRVATEPPGVRDSLIAEARDVVRRARECAGWARSKP